MDRPTLMICTCGVSHKVSPAINRMTKLITVICLKVRLYYDQPDQSKFYCVCLTIYGLKNHRKKFTKPTFDTFLATQS